MLLISRADCRMLDICCKLRSKYCRREKGKNFQYWLRRIARAIALLLRLKQKLASYNYNVHFNYNYLLLVMCIQMFDLIFNYLIHFSSIFLFFKLHYIILILYAIRNTVRTLSIKNV